MGNSRGRARANGRSKAGEAQGALTLDKPHALKG